MRDRQPKPGYATMMPARGILMMGLLCHAAKASTRVQAPAIETDSFDKHRHLLTRVHRNSDESDGNRILRTIITSYDRQATTSNSLWNRWSESTLGSGDFSLEWNLDSGGGPLKYEGNVALLITPTHKAGPGGRFFGIDEKFTGLAVIIEVKPDSELGWSFLGEEHKVSIIANDGTRSYDDLMANLEGCTKRMKFGELGPWNNIPSSRIRLKAHHNTVTLDVDPGNEGVWERCARIALRDLPVDWAHKSHVGVIPPPEGLEQSTFLSVKVNLIPERDLATDSKGEDKDQQDGLLTPMYHEPFGLGPKSTTGRHFGVKQEEDPISIRKKRILGKMRLEQSCSDSDDCAICHHHRGSVHKLENCLKKRGSNISTRCNEEIKIWKALLAETAPGARHMPLESAKTSPINGRPSRLRAEQKNDKPLTRGRGLPQSKHIRGERDGSIGRVDSGRRGPSPFDLHQDNGGRSDQRYRSKRDSANRPIKGTAEVGDSPNNVEIVLVMGSVCALLVVIFFVLYFFVLLFLTGVDRLSKWLGQDARVHGGGRGGNGPVGYHTLPGVSPTTSTTSATVSGQRWFGSGRVGGDNARVDDDDMVVVTGTPVSPPPCVHL